MNPLLNIDGYKTDHRSQYPDKTELVYSNFTPRGSRVPEVDKVVFFGLQYFIKKYLIEEFDNEFFNRPKKVVLNAYKRRLDNYLGKNAVSTEHIAALHDLGYLPLQIKALPEGTLVPLRIPMFTIQNTKPEFFWLTNMLETLMSNILWMPCTSATTAYRYKKTFNQYADVTVGNRDFVPFQGHDFSFRGLAGVEAACMSGAGHLLSFVGTDTIPAIDFLERYYNANSDNEMVGVSVPATEHSVMCMGGFEGEIFTFDRLITEIYPKGIVSIVSDTWNFWQVLTSFLPMLKSKILARDGKVVIRPDSGDPVKIICGDINSPIDSPEYQGAIECLWNVFRGRVNELGYKELDPHIGLIYGDSITPERQKEILFRLEEKGFASNNIVLGIGSFTYQYVTRDTFGFAMKATYGRVNGVPKAIYKDPKTDDGLKKSARGLLCVVKNEHGELTLKDDVSVFEEDSENNQLKTVFYNGELRVDTSLQEIRERLNEA